MNSGGQALRIPAAGVDAAETEWQFDALDLRPVLRWLDDHDVYPKRETPERRVMSLDWFQMLGLMREAGYWVQEQREEADPPGADGEFE